ncbi:unnamed protein product [Aphanomyces euteiches]
MAKLTVAAANDLYECVISSFEASQGEPNVPDALKDKPKEFFSQIAAKWRNQLEQYKLPHDESIEIAPEPTEPLAVEDEEKSDDAADIKQHRPGFDLNAIGRPAPFMVGKATSSLSDCMSKGGSPQIKTARRSGPSSFRAKRIQAEATSYVG